MGLFDFWKKKTKEEANVEQTEKNDILEIEGIEVETNTQDDNQDIVFHVDENKSTTSAINQAVGKVMDDEPIEFHQKAGGTLYAEDDAEVAIQFTVEPEPEPAVEETVESEPEPAVEETVESEPEPAVGETVEPEPEPEVEEALEPEPEPEVEEALEPEPEPAVEKTVEPEPEPAVEKTVESEPEKETQKEKKGFFAKLKEGLDKTRKNIMSGVDTVLGSFTKIDEDLFEELEEALIMADMGVQTTMQIVENLRQRVKRERVTDPSAIKGMLIDEITAILQDNTEDVEELPSPTVMLVIGVNGVGKTTTIGKLSNNFKAEGKSVLLAAADTFRAAAIDQLEVWGQRAGIDVIKHEENADPAAVVFDALHTAKNKKTDLLICDTAGRLHNKKNLMEELRKISRVIEREYPTAHKETYLVLDATTGQNALQQAKLFMEVADITGIILTKLDGTAKGGIVVAIKSELKIPVRYIGVGEGIADLQKFHANDFAKALFGEA